MTEKRHATKVSVAGEDLTIRSDEPPEHVAAVAEYLDRAIRAVLRASPTIDVTKAAILAAMQITDEMLKTRSITAKVEEEMDSLSAEIRRWLPPAKRGDTGEQVAISG